MTIEPLHYHHDCPPRAARITGLVMAVLLLQCGIAKARKHVGASNSQSETLTWSSKDCPACKSSILNPGWYSDGSGLFVETMEGNPGVALAAVSALGGNFVVAVGFGITAGQRLKIDPMDSVTLETDSGPKTVLYPLARPDSTLPKGWFAVKKRFRNQSVTLKPGGYTEGYLFFPVDANASRVVVAVQEGSEVFQFPFRRDPIFRSKFVDPMMVEKVATNLRDEQVARPEQGSTISVPVRANTPETTGGIGAQGREEAEARRCATGQHWIATSYGGYCGSEDASTRQTLAGRPATPLANSSVTTQGQRGNIALACEKSIAFAVAGPGGVTLSVPKFARKWAAKNARKFPKR